MTGRFAWAWALGISALVVGCGSSSDGAKAPGLGSPPASESQTPEHPVSCTTPAEGCACVDDGKQVDCGEVISRSGDYVACSTGKRSCVDGKWGACKGDGFAASDTPPKQTMAASPGLHGEALGAVSPCFDNPCDPYCNNYADGGAGLTPGTGLVIDGGAITLKPSKAGTLTPGSCTGISVTPVTTTVSVKDTITVAPTSSGRVPGLFAAFFPSYYTGGVPSTWKPMATWIDPNIQYNWNDATSPTRVVPDARWNNVYLNTIRWQGYLTPAHDGYYWIQPSSTDKLKASLNGSSICDDWYDWWSTTPDEKPCGGTWQYLKGGVALPLDIIYSPQIKGRIIDLTWWDDTRKVSEVIPASMFTTDVNLFSYWLDDTQRTTHTFSGPGNIQLTAALTPSGCSSTTLKPIWTLDRPDMGVINSAGVVSLYTSHSGNITVSASQGSLKGSATLNVTFNVTDTSFAPSGFSGSSFSGATAGSDNIRMLYPYNGTMLPLGLPPPIVQWDNMGANANAVKATLTTGSAFTYSQIITEMQQQPAAPNGATDPGTAAQPRWLIAPAIWSAFEQAAKGSTGTITIQRIVGGKLLAPNSPVTLKFSTEPLKGTVYYEAYNTGYSTSTTYQSGDLAWGAAILSIKPGATTPTRVGGPSNACETCHSASVGGGTLITQRADPITNNQDATELYSLPGGARREINAVNTGQGLRQAAITPDGTLLFTNSGPPVWYDGAGNSGPAYLQNTELHSAVNGSYVGSNGLPAFHGQNPAFSPDGKHIVFTPLDGTFNGIAGNHTQFGAIDYDQPSYTFSNARILDDPAVEGLNGKQFEWYGFLPDSRHVVAELEDAPAGKVLSYGQTMQTPWDQTREPLGQLYYLDSQVSGHQAPVLMNNANGHAYLPPDPYARALDSDEHLNFEPTVNPTMTGGLAWTVFTSRRRYGNLTHINPYHSDPRGDDLVFNISPKKLWVAAIDPKAAAGTDPSYPAFYLPGQELYGTHGSGYWVVDPCTPSGSGSANECTTNEECCGAAQGTAVCRLDVPVTSTTNPLRHCDAQVTGAACGNAGAACATSSECCSGMVCASDTGQCTVPPTFNASGFAAANYTRSPDYEGVCAPGSHVVWRYFQWKSSTPLDSYIEFYAQSQDDATLFVTVPVATTMVSATTVVATGVASGADAITWTSSADGKTVDDKLKAAGMFSRRYLRITARLVPSSNKTQTPRLVAWRANYSCAPSE